MEINYGLSQGANASSHGSSGLKHVHGGMLHPRLLGLSAGWALLMTCCGAGLLCMTHQHRGVERTVTTQEIVCPFQGTNELLSNKEQNQTKIASYLQILYFLKYYSPTTVKALINSQSLFSSRGTSGGLDCQR